MKPEEAIEVLSNELCIITDIISYCRDFEDCNDMALAYRIKRQEAYKTAISALKEVQQYREIGTVEECREAAEKRRAKKPKFLHMLNDTKYTAECKCGYRFTADIDCRYNPQFCSKCGVKFDWSEDSEGMEDD